MTTTFTSRQLVRDELVSLFTSDGTWQNVYGYFPSASEVVGKSPLLVIRSRGTSQQFSNLDTNPTSYRMMLTTMVIAGSGSDATITSSGAEDNLDTLDKTLRQVIRDNAGSMTTANNLRFESGYSDVSDAELGGVPYILETYTVIADLMKGSI